MLLKTANKDSMQICRMCEVNLRTVPTNSEVFLPGNDFAREVDVTKGY